MYHVETYRDRKLVDISAYPEKDAVEGALADFLTWEKGIRRRLRDLDAAEYLAAIRDDQWASDRIPGGHEKLVGEYRQEVVVCEADDCVPCWERQAWDAEVAALAGGSDG